MSRRNILVCGGGNGAHCIAAIAARTQPEADISVLTLYADEAERWSKSLEQNPLKGIRVHKDGTTDEFDTKPKLVTKDPSVVVPSADMIFMVVPAFAHEQYLKALAPYVKDNTILVGLPTKCGFEFQCRSILGDKTKTCSIVSFETLPWACRILEFGTSIKILGTKDTIGASVLKGSECTLEKSDILDKIQRVFGEFPKILPVQNYLAIILMSDACIHPPIMYGKWGKWDGTPLSEKPLFYQGVDEVAADYLTKVSNEVVATAREIARQQSGVDMKDVVPLIDWYKNHYSDQLVDDSSLMRALQTNKAYDGLIHPMKETSDGKFVPDFSYRYTSEDIPFGMVVLKGLALLAGVDTPVMDEVLAWAQGKLGKEFIVGSELEGKDLPQSRAPQNYGFKTVDDLFKF
ncbi:hypothetical protein FSP39_019846 [Pinctada imbricata]|uniref:Opine dehydrogenase domain-containing protein n=1 Tax=Pinctada imbricata TaxID=66713 RepID=A0AA88XW15_PINIB|nr:hypothetical protein FSP39_019846 [Pinctada imbricata]